MYISQGIIVLQENYVNIFCLEHSYNKFLYRRLSINKRKNIFNVNENILSFIISITGAW